MKRLFSLMLGLCLSVQAFAETEVDVVWHYKNVNNQIALTGIGDKSLTHAVLPSTINGLTVTKIDGIMFSGCTNLETVTIPSTISVIADNALMNDYSSITNYVVDAGNPSFSSSNGILYNKNKTTLVRYPSGRTNEIHEVLGTVDTIHWFAFSDSIHLKEIVLPSMTETVCAYAFRECRGLEKVNFPQSQTSVGRFTFYNCDSLETITLPNTIENLDQSAFESCDNLREFVCPANLSSLGSYVFQDCSNLTSVVFNPSLEYIESSMFRRCTSVVFG